MQLRRIQASQAVGPPSVTTCSMATLHAARNSNSRQQSPVHPEIKAACRWLLRSLVESRLGVGPWSPLTLCQGRGDGAKGTGAKALEEQTHITTTPGPGTASGAPGKIAAPPESPWRSAPPSAQAARPHKVFSACQRANPANIPCTIQTPRQQQSPETKPTTRQRLNHLLGSPPGPCKKQHQLGQSLRSRLGLSMAG